MWYVYILKCRDGSLYTGITNDLQKRIDRHNDGSGARYTKVRRPVKLLYNEQFSTKGEALKREIEVKNFSRENKKRLIQFGLGSNPSPHSSKSREARGENLLRKFS